MKRMILAACAVAALSLTGTMPFAGTDVAELLPVQTLTVDRKQGQVILDGGLCRGTGENWAAALEDLEAGAEGEVFLGTAEQVLLTEEALEVLPDVIRCARLRPAAVICVCRGELPEVEDVTVYLSAHDAGVTIQKVQAAMVRGGSIRLPVLEQMKGGLRLRGTEDR